MEGYTYVRSEYGNLWETHQFRPHAYGHTWSLGCEIHGGMLHGHAVGTRAWATHTAPTSRWKEGFITEGKFVRVMRLISDVELALYHPVMDTHDMNHAAQVEVADKRGGTLCAPLPRGSARFVDAARSLSAHLAASPSLVGKMHQDAGGGGVHSAVPSPPSASEAAVAFPLPLLPPLLPPLPLPWAADGRCSSASAQALPKAPSSWTARSTAREANAALSLFRASQRLCSSKSASATRRSRLSSAPRAETSAAASSPGRDD